ncbi:hypothetical protein ALI144C_22590 [Actinosynnema sp. ALI-1.44]|uniref:pyridoxamine 5'-phosphate oxidase family protein n=1 Tax=Actinosynnema sp. ALI-1.44 TaxID=1933779 RepID=UPI00097C1105|nr:pyridoxamine 5'-phosphate oxidase family protein [Actinosynnema sp. ALI-1.44]ONI81308.1 hypothetical protein ALI144C_22590 [Actinosynnema sp. ALI-1.44]
MTNQIELVARTLAERRSAAQERVQASSQFWLASGSSQGPHLIPVAYVWDSGEFVTATFERSRTVSNLKRTSHARIALGDTTDVVMVDARARFVPVPAIDPNLADRYAEVSHDPRSMPGFVYIRLTPERIQVWNGFHEFSGRTVMQNSQWLTAPVD